MPASAPDQPISVFIVEDNDLLRHDFARSVSESPRLRLLGAAARLEDARRFLDRGPALDVLLLDLELPDGDGTGLIAVLRRQVPQARALVISVFADDGPVLNALAAGAQGYLLKDTTDEALVQAIVDVARGDAPIAPQVARYLLRMFGTPGAARPATAGSERLTPREAEILGLIAGGHSGNQVAERLGLSLHTINTHLRNCHVKLHARNRLQAINRARNSGQIG